MDTLNEDTNRTINVAFWSDAAQTVPATPVADVDYGFWCLTNGRLLSTGTVTADSDVDITISDTATAIIDNANTFEDRQLVWRAAISSGVYHINYYNYRVRNLRGPLRYHWFKGDSYLNADSRAIRCTCGKAVPDLDGTVSLKIEDPNSVVDTLTVTGTIVTATGSLKDLRFDLTAAQTATLTAGDYSVTVFATQQSGAIITIKKGRATVTDKAI